MQNRISFVLVFLLCWSVVALGQQASSFQLTKVEFAGLKKYDRQQALVASELKIGQAVTLEMLDAAGEKLAKIGYFRRVNYRYQTGGGKIEVVFDVDEVGSAVPCIFDNFAGFSDQEIVDEVRREIPSFDGTAPETGDLVSKIKGALERMLQKQKLPGQVDHIFSVGSNAGYRPEHVFTIKNVRLPVCKALVSGAAGISLAEVTQAAQSLVGSDYSKIAARTVAELEVAQVFKRYGYLRIRFKPPIAELDFGSACNGGVVVVLPAEPGFSYTLERIGWQGNQTISTAALNEKITVKPGEVADWVKIEGGLREIYRGYLTKGFLAAQLVPDPQFDNAEKQVTINILISEGQQFRFNTLTILGVTDKEAQRCKERWRLKSGDAYDSNYVNEYVQKLFEEGVLQFNPAKRMKFDAKPNPQKATVDVTINFDAKSE